MNLSDPASTSVDQLRETIIALDKTTKDQTDTMVKLTWCLVGLTIILTIATIVLVVDAFH